MKRILSVVVVLFAVVFSSLGQDKSSKDFQFVYVAHDENTAVRTLLDRLRETYNDARNYPDSRELIIYLANDENPVIVQVNTADDNKEDFEEIVEELNTKTSHTINPAFDRARIVELFNENDIMDDNGNPEYLSVEWTYYVNSTFWSMNCNEYLISALYFIMDMKRMMASGYLNLYVLYSGDDPLPYDSEMPFGTKALYSALPFMPLPY